MPRPKFKVDYSSLVSNQGEPLSPASIAIYKAALNKFAAYGYDSKEDLMKNQSDIIKIVKDDFSTKAKRRVALSAIFRVLSDVPNNSKRRYYDLFQECKEFPSGN